MVYFLSLLLFLIPTSGLAKKLKIHKCELANGTISFQEDKCTVDVYNLMPQKSKEINEKKPIKRIADQKSVKKPKKETKNTQIKKQNRHIDFVSAGNGVLNANVGRYRMAINLPKQWQYFKKVFSNKLYHIKMNNKQAGMRASLIVDFVFPDNKNFSQKEIDDLVHLLGSRFVKKSKETQVNIQKFRVDNGKGAITTFTSNEYMPKYRYTTKGAIFKNKWLIQFTLLSNNLQGSSHHNALYALSQTIKIVSS
jgi:hypothetical protein